MLVELQREIARALHPSEGVRTQLGLDRAAALRVLLTFFQARMCLLCIQTLVPVKRVEESGEVIVQGLRSADQRIVVRDRAASERPVVGGVRMRRAPLASNVANTLHVQANAHQLIKWWSRAALSPFLDSHCTNCEKDMMWLVSQSGAMVPFATLSR